MAASVRVSRPWDASCSLSLPTGRASMQWTGVKEEATQNKVKRGVNSGGAKEGHCKLWAHTHTSVHLCKPCTKLNREGEQVPEVHIFAIVCSKISHFLGAFAQGPTSNKNNMVVPPQSKTAAWLLLSRHPGQRETRQCQPQNTGQMTRLLPTRRCSTHVINRGGEKRQEQNTQHTQRAT